MVAVVAGELSPLMSGHIYCSVILACREVFAFGRSRQWTDALARWCESQPQLIAFTGSCRVHRAEIMQLRGAWRDAIEEAGQACARFRTGIDPQAPAPAFYQRGEMHQAARSLRRRRGRLPPRQPVRLRAAARPGAPAARPRPHPRRGGRHSTGLIAVGVSGAGARLRGQDPHRARLLPAQVEIALAAGETEEADQACRELERIAATMGPGVPEAIAVQARGAILLARGDAAAALIPLRRALEVWQAIAAPYETARVRVLLGVACRELGDADGAELALAAARATFDDLGAKPDVARVDAIAGRPSPRAPPTA